MKIEKVAGQLQAGRARRHEFVAPLTLLRAGGRLMAMPVCV